MLKLCTLFSGQQADLSVAEPNDTLVTWMSQECGSMASTLFSYGIRDYLAAVDDQYNVTVSPFAPAMRGVCRVIDGSPNVRSEDVISNWIPG